MKSFVSWTHNGQITVTSYSGFTFCSAFAPDVRMFSRWWNLFYQLRLEASWWVWTWRACCTWPSLRGVFVLAHCHGWYVRKAESSCSRSLEFDARFLLGWDHETSWDPEVATVCISQEQRFLPRIWDAMASLNITGKVRFTKCFVGVKVEGS